MNKERDRDSKECWQARDLGAGKSLSPSLSARLIPDEKGTENGSVRAQSTRFGLVATYAAMKRIKRVNKERDRDSKECWQARDLGAGKSLSPSLSTRLIPDEEGTES